MPPNPRFRETPRANPRPRETLRAEVEEEEGKEKKRKETSTTRPPLKSTQCKRAPYPPQPLPSLPPTLLQSPPPLHPLQNLLPPPYQTPIQIPNLPQISHSAKMNCPKTTNATRAYPFFKRQMSKPITLGSSSTTTSSALNAQK